MSASRQRLKITAVLELDTSLYPRDDEACQAWIIEDILLGGILDRLVVVSHEIGDELGVLHVEHVEELPS